MSIAFKEWQVVCDALATGRQTIILRKGGIHEGRAGFSFAHDSFLLFPTKFHAQADHVREGEFTPGSEWEPGEKVLLTHHAHVTHAVTLSDWKQVVALEPYHIYKERTLRERFEWEGKGMSSGSIHLAVVRVFALEKPLRLTYDSRFGGCRSWVDLGVPYPETPIPVIGQEAFVTISAAIDGICAL